MDATSHDNRATLHKQLENWREELLDLSKRNRLLRFRHTRTTTLEIRGPGHTELLRRLPRGVGFASLPFKPAKDAGSESPDKAEEDHPATQEEKDLAAGAEEAPSTDVRKKKRQEITTQRRYQEDLDASLRRIARESQRAALETGIWVLYLAVGFLQWKDPKDQDYSRAPLVLVPVELRATGDGGYRLHSSDAAETVVNPSIGIKLAEYGIDWSRVEEASPEDPGEVLDAVRRCVAKQRDWTVDDSMVVARFTFHKEAMYRDLIDNEARILDHPLVRAVASDPRISADDPTLAYDLPPLERLDEVQEPESTSLVLDADAYQRRAVAAACQGKSFVLNGPPGTGKSQTIANIIAGLVHAGRTVLFVSEKAAALDVVHKRLASCRIDITTLPLHDGKTRGGAVAKALNRALRARIAPMPRQAADWRKEARRLRERLSTHAQAINEVDPETGLSLHQALGVVGSRPEGMPDDAELGVVTPDAALFTREGRARIRRTAKDMVHAWEVFAAPEKSPWFGIEQVDEAEEALRRALTALTELVGQQQRYARIAGDRGIPSVDRAHRWIALLDVLDECDDVPPHWFVSADFDTEVARPVAEAAGRLTELASLRARADFDWKRVSRLPTVDGIEKGTPTAAEPPTTIPLAALTGAEARELAELCGEWARRMADAAGTVEETVRRTGLPVPGEHQVAQRLLAVAVDLSAEPLPEPRWLPGSRVQEVRASLGDFTRQRAQLRTSRDAAKDLFHPRVLDRDDLTELQNRLRTWRRAVQTVTERGDVPAHWLTAADFTTEVRTPATAAWERWRTYVHAETDLRAFTRVDWRTLPDVAAHTDPEGAGTDFDTAGLGADRARSDAEFFDRWARTLENLLATGRDIARTLSLPVPEDHDSVHTTLEIAARLESATMPSPAWLDEDALRAARETAQDARAQVAELAQARETASDLFHENRVLTQEWLAELCERFTGYGALSRLGSTYRADRKLASSLTVTGNWDRRIPERLGEALRWQRAHRELEQRSTDYQTVLGEYWDGEDTDFTALDTAFCIAGLMVASAPETDRSGVRRFLAHGEPLGEAANQRARTALDELRSWREAQKYLPDGAVLTERPLAEAVAWLRGAAARLRSDTGLIDLLTPAVGKDATTTDQARGIRDALLRLREAWVNLDQEEKADRAVLGPFWQAPINRETELRQALDWAEQANRVCRETLDGLVDGVRGEPADITSLREQAAVSDVAESDPRVQGVLGTAYHRDRALAASLTLNSRWQDEITDRLDDARRWHRDHWLLREQFPRFADVFGSFWLEEETDTAGAEEAVAKAERWRRELDSQELAVLASFLSQGDLSDLADSLEQARHTLEEWPTVARTGLGGTAAVARLAPEHATRWLDANTERVAHAAQTVEGAFGTAAASATVAEADRRIRFARQLQAAEAVREQSETADRSLLGRLYRIDKNLDDVLGQAVDWARGVHDIVSGLRADSSEGWSAEAITGLQAGKNTTDLRRAIEEWEEARQAFTALFQTAVRQRLAEELGEDLTEAEKRLLGMRDSVASLDQWRTAASTGEEIRRYGLEALLRRYVQAGGDPNLWPDAVERAVLRAWVDQRLAEDGRLRLEPGEARDAEVAEFRSHDVRLQEWARYSTLHHWAARRSHVRSQSTGITVIKREAEKKRRHKPVRRLMEEAGSDVRDITPCLMMSPLTVSMFLPPELTFDVVIFDEASQVKPADAINCVYRGRALIVAGDQKQLPPTSFFDRVADEDEEWNEEDPDSFQSLLDMCKASGRMRELPLRWHYRSRHEDLIAFSNRKFYDGELVTFPGARVEDNNTGVVFFRADGVYDRGGRRNNRIEAELVAQRVIHHFRTRPGLTLGVVAMSREQADAIEDAVDKAFDQYPELRSRTSGDDRLDGFFVKNLETVQGDERDVIILSVGYGPTSDGKFHKNFGPLNRPDGYRRLNVAITRAKHRVEVVASFSADQVALGPNDAEGLRRLCEYLRYAEYGHAVLDPQPTGDRDEDTATESPFEDSVMAVLREWGYDVQPRVGVAGYRVDLGVRHPQEPGRYAIGIECDGAMYHSSRVARDRDRLREGVLRNLGWRLHRIWGTEWYRDREEAEKRLREAVEAAIAETTPRDDAEPPAEPVEDVQEQGTAQEAEGPIVEIPDEDDGGDVPEPVAHGRPWLEEYVEAEVAESVIPHDLDPRSPEARPYLQQMFSAIAAVESPIERDLLFRRAFDHWPEGTRLTKPVRQNFAQALQGLIRGKLLHKKDDTVWAPGSELSVRRPAPGQDPRRVAEVPPVERREAMRMLVAESRRVARETLLRSTREVFGWKRSGKDITAALTKDLEALLDSGELAEEDGLIVPAEPPGEDR
ncbi:DUF4011 domain-containing protein [Thermobifida halotolerans]|uniref:DUF4011 domain-containing protein n=1 Tax=Thermobifida halotolerans TaxID=483545 RepID=A0AA97LXS7_9ACTN|nr:DUF4011 domain-containing protein [Thermobifida halotolerans]UOE19815.1 DUF4011 domain-containing protein [Thermobifida halotolerans]